ncbi:MAG TPA: Ig-like domain-containing protein, partial [Armatimonadota bacterium]
GAFNHYVAEGGSQILSFSPWMSSLMAHALLRTYHTTGDSRIPGMLVGLAQAEVDRALYQATFDGGVRLWVPRYVASSYGDPTVFDTTENDPPNDLEHSSDVAYVIALGAYFTSDAAQKARFVDAASSLLVSNNYLLRYWTRPIGYPSNGAPLYRVSPPRKYNWWFKNTGAIGSLLGSLPDLPDPTQDLVPPTVSITSPSSGVTLTGPTVVTASATDNAGVVGVQFSLDGAPLGAEVTQAPYTTSFDPTRLSAGPHSLVAIARDAAGNSTTSAAISLVMPSLLPTITFQNGVGGYAGQKDVNINNMYGGAGSTSDGYRLLLLNSTGTGAYDSRALLRFDGLTLPAGAKVSSATLTLSYEHGIAGASVQGYYLRSAFATSPLSATNWVNRNTGTPWSAGGASGDGTDRIAGKSFCLTNFDSTEGQVKTVALDPAVVQGWVDNPASNQGVVLQNTAPDKIAWLYSSQHTVAGLRPRLTIVFAAGDTVAPNAVVTSPGVGADLSGTTMVCASATDDVGVTGIQLLLDGTALAPEQASAACDVILDTTKLPNGTHTLNAKAWDAAGNVGVSAAVSFLVDNDTTAPTVRIASPTVVNVAVRGLLPVTVEATDNKAVASVQLLVDGKAVGPALTSAPYTSSIDTGLLTVGSHVLSATACDAAGNTATSSTVAFQVAPKPSVTVSFQTGVSSYSGTKDVAINNLYGGAGTTSDSYRLLVTSGSGTNPYESRALLRFDGLNLPAGAVVTSASLTLTFEHAIFGAQLQGYYLNTAWNASTSAVNWLNRDTGKAWSTPGASGADRVAGKSFTVSGFNSTTNQQKRITLDTSVVQNWVSNPTSNQGIVLANPVLDKTLWLYSSEQSKASQRPLLTITYTVP